VKRGIVVTPGNKTGLRFNMIPGTGLHVVEYSTGGLAREEVALRLRTLETLVDELEAKLAGAENPQMLIGTTLPHTAIGGRPQPRLPQSGGSAGRALRRVSGYCLTPTIRF
jgi:hypothetical protein